MKNKRLKVGQTIYLPFYSSRGRAEIFTIRIASNKYPLPEEGCMGDFYPLWYVQDNVSEQRYFTSRRKCESYCKIVNLTGRWY